LLDKFALYLVVSWFIGGSVLVGRLLRSYLLRVTCTCFYRHGRLEIKDVYGLKMHLLKSVNLAFAD